MSLTVRVAREDRGIQKLGFRQKFFRSSENVPVISEPSSVQRSFCPQCYDILSGTREPTSTDVIYRHYRYHETAWQIRESVSQGCWVCSIVWDHFSASEQQNFMNLNTLFNSNLVIANYRDAKVSWSSIGYEPRVRGQFSFILRDLKGEDVFDLNGEVECLDALHEQTTNSIQSWKIAYDWILKCSEGHQTCNSLRDKDVWHPTRLVDIGIDHSSVPRLVCTSEESIVGPYLTLSHCWGQAGFLKLTESNLDCFKTKFPVDALSQTFQDAVEAARRLGVRYIWIDSLCIIQQQDSKEDWLRESPKMQKIYSNSFCNIAAAASSDSSGGLFRRRNPHLVFPPPIHNSHLQSDCHVVLDHEWETQLLNAPLLKRGWVVQERILAPRVLHFGRHQLLWECCEMEASERFPHLQPFRFMHKHAHVGYKRNLVPGIEQAISEQIAFREEESKTTDLYISTSQLWDRIITAYTRTQLTYATDKLIAIAGIAAKIQSLVDVDYLAGIWGGRRLLCHLLWYVQKPLRKRPIHDRAPSFSWASVDGTILPMDSWAPELRVNSRALTAQANISYNISDFKDDSVVGQANTGSLTVKALLKDFNNDYLNFRPDVELHGNANTNYVFLPVLFFNGTSDQCFGLVLECANHEANQYRRVGMCNYSFSQWGKLAPHVHNNTAHMVSCSTDSKKHTIYII